MKEQRVKLVEPFRRSVTAAERSPELRRKDFTEKKKGVFNMIENSLFVPRTGELSNQVVEDFLKFCEMPDCQSASGGNR